MRDTAISQNSTHHTFRRIVWLVMFLFLISLAGFASSDGGGYLSGRVWNDTDNDGLIGDDEPGVEGVTLYLERQDTGEILTAVTDENGEYIFSDLENDSYTISIDVPDGMLFAPYKQEGGDLRSIMTGEDTTITRSYVVRESSPVSDVYIGLIDSAIIQGMAYLDLNYNGTYDEGEPAYEGVTMQVIKNSSETSMGKVITGEDGLYSFNNIREGNYRLRAILPDDGSTFTLVPETETFLSNLFEAREGRRENSISSIDVENSLIYEYYVGVAIGGTISGTVYQDSDYSGVYDNSDRILSSISVQLVTSDGEVVATTKSNNKGVYTFEDVMPGDYQIRFLRKEDYAFTKYRPTDEGGNDVYLLADDDYGETEVFSFTMGETLTDINAGMLECATLSGTFFLDENDNGLMDEGEVGFTDGSVRLVSTDGEIDITQSINEDGSYYFSGVIPTTYTLYYQLPEHAEMAQVVSGGNTLAHQGTDNAIENLTFTAGQDYTADLVGAILLGTFEGYVYLDVNANGVYEDGEDVVNGATITFTAEDTQTSVSATTGSDGTFSVTGLRPNDYLLEIQLPDGLIFSSDITASNITTDTSSSYSALISFDTLTQHPVNEIGAVKPASISASVWLDENQNGSEDSDERLLTGLEFTLYDEVNQKYVASTQSGDDGIAVFNNVRPSTYTVSFELPDDSEAVSGVGTFVQNGSTMSQSGIVIEAGDTFDSIFGGLVSTTSLGGSVDLDEADQETPVEGVEVILYSADSGEVMQSTLTDESGEYRFDGLWPGNYIIEVIRPDDLIFVRQDDPEFASDDTIIHEINDTIGTSETITVTMADDQLDLHVMLTTPAKIGTLVWLDENANGLIDGEETMINGVTVNLLQDGEIVYTTVSNEWGYYEFSNVYPGEYTLEAIAYPELTITSVVDDLRIISSCLVSGDGTAAYSDSFTVEGASTNFFYHLGYQIKEGEEMPSEITEGATQDWSLSNITDDE